MIVCLSVLAPRWIQFIDGHYVTAGRFFCYHGEVETLTHTLMLHKQTALPCDTCTSTSPPQHLSPQWMITGFNKAVTASLPILVVPAGGPLLPLSSCIISLRVALLAYGRTRGLKRFIRIYFCSFCGVPMECCGASAAGLTLRFKRSNSP